MSQQMLSVAIPSLLRPYTNGAETLQLPLAQGEICSVREALERLNQQYPQLLQGLLYQDDLMPGMAVFVDNEQALMGLKTKVRAGSEVLFAPPIVGG